LRDITANNQKPGWIKYLEYLEKLPPIYKNLPQLSIEERDQRWKRIRGEMLLWGLDCLLVWGSDAQFGLTDVNFRYVTAIPATTGRCLAVFPLKGDPIAFVGTEHNHYEGASFTWVSDVRIFPSADDVIKIVKEMGFERCKIGLVGDMHHFWPFILQYHIWADVQKGLPEVNFIDAAPLLWGLEMIKSPEEIKFLEEAGRIAGLVYKALVKIVRPGVKECEVYANILQAMVSNGAEPNGMILIDSGNPVLAHPRYPPPTNRRLEKGDIFITEYHTKYAGYQTHTERSVSIGKPQKESMEIYEVCKEAYYAGLEKMKPGVSFREAVEALRAPVYKVGMEGVECGFHAHGITSAGFPSFIKSDDHLDEIESITIKENMVFTNQIDLFNPKWPKGGGMILGDSFLVTKDGPRVFVDIPLELAIVLPME